MSFFSVGTVYMPTKRPRSSPGSMSSKNDSVFKRLKGAIETKDTNAVKALISDLRVKDLTTSFSYMVKEEPLPYTRNSMYLENIRNMHNNIKHSKKIQITLIGYAVMLERATILRMILDAKPSVATCALPKGVYAPLELAFLFRKTSMYPCLLKKKAPIRDLIHDAVMADDLDTVKLFIQYGANVNLKHNETGMSPLETAASLGVVKALVEAGANVNSRNAMDIPGGTPLMAFITFETLSTENSRNVIKYYIEKGTDLKRRARDPARGISNLNALHLFAMNETKYNSDGFECLKLLVNGFKKQGISLDEKMSDGMTPLTYMLKRVVDKDKYQRINYTVAMDEIVYLLDHGAKSQHNNLSNTGFTYIEHIVMSLLPEQKICKLFENNRVKLTDTKYPFHLMVRLLHMCSTSFLKSSKQMKHTVKHLIGKGFDINIKNSTVPKTPIEMIDTLTKYSAPSNRKKKLLELRRLFISSGMVPPVTENTPPTRKTSKTQKNFIREWTNFKYRDVQNARRKGIQVTSNIERINRYISQEMRNSGTRAAM